MQPSAQKAKIESARMDGSDRQVLNASQVQWPNSLYLDLKGGRLYWTEAYYDRILSMNLNGSDVRVSVWNWLELHALHKLKNKCVEGRSNNQKQDWLLAF